jgi:type VI protein secretion system component Hcp
MALDMYLFFESPTNGAKPIVGEAQDANLRAAGTNPIKLKSFSFEIVNKATIGVGSGGASSGRCELGSFQISKTTDSCTPDFFTGCATGGHYGKATILVRKDGKNFIQYSFSLVFTTKVNWSGDEGSESPAENIEYVYGALQITYFPQKSDGTLKSPKMATWNQVNNSFDPVVTQH